MSAFFAFTEKKNNCVVDIDYSCFNQVMDEIEQHKIRIYEFPDCDSDEDDDFKQQDRELKVITLSQPISSDHHEDVMKAVSVDWSIKFAFICGAAPQNETFCSRRLLKKMPFYLKRLEMLVI